MDWSDNAVIANHKQVCSIIDAFNHGISLSDSPGPMDSWLLARLRVNQNSWRECMDAVSLREGVMASHFEMLAEIGIGIYEEAVQIETLRGNSFVDGRRC